MEGQKRIILFVSNDLVGDNRVHKMALTLSEAHYDVCVVGRFCKNSIDIQQVTYKIKRFHLVFSKGPLFYAELNIRIFLYLLFHSYTIATANDLDTLLGVFCASKLRRKEIVYDSHEYFTELPELVHRQSVKKIWLTIEKWIFPKLKHCITVCDSIAQVYETQYHVPVKVVRNVPFLLENFEKQQPQYLLYQGALNVGRGLDLLIEAMQFIDAKLLIIGDGDVREQLEILAQQMNVTNKVSFLGRIPYDALLPYTQKAILGFSLEEDFGASYHFALPNKFFDYIQAEVPVFVSNLPEMASIVHHYYCGEILKERTPRALASQVNELLQNGETMNFYRKNCSIARKELCWENEKSRVLQVYDF